MTEVYKIHKKFWLKEACIGGSCRTNYTDVVEDTLWVATNGFRFQN